MKFKPTGKHNAVFDIVLEKGHNEKIVQNLWEMIQEQIRFLKMI